MNDRCKDCRTRSARDVFRGVCTLSKETVLIDTPACPKFACAAKCKYCVKYQPAEKDNLGVCGGVMVYPDLTGCENFTAR